MTRPLRTAAELAAIFAASRGRWELCMAHMSAEEFCRRLEG